MTVWTAYKNKWYVTFCFVDHTMSAKMNNTSHFICGSQYCIITTIIQALPLSHIHEIQTCSSVERKKWESKVQNKSQINTSQRHNCTKTSNRANNPSLWVEGLFIATPSDLPLGGKDFIFENFWSVFVNIRKSSERKTTFGTFYGTFGVCYSTFWIFSEVATVVSEFS